MLQRVLAETDSNSQGEVVDLLIDQLLAEPNHTFAARPARHGRGGACAGVAARRAERRRLGGAGRPGAAQARRGGRHHLGQGPVPRAQSGEPIDVALTGIYSRDRSRISVEATIDGLKPSMLADLSPDAALLRGLDIALSGRLQVEANGSGEVRTVAIDVTGGDGTHHLARHPAGRRTRCSRSARWRMSMRPRTPRRSIISTSISAPPRSPSPAPASAPRQGQTFTGRAEVKNIPVDKLGDYWPLEFADGRPRMGARQSRAAARSTSAPNSRSARRATTWRSSRSIATWPSSTIAA